MASPPLTYEVRWPSPSRGPGAGTGTWRRQSGRSVAALGRTPAEEGSRRSLPVGMCLDGRLVRRRSTATAKISSRFVLMKARPIAGEISKASVKRGKSPRGGWLHTYVRRCSLFSQLLPRPCPILRERSLSVRCCSRLAHYLNASSVAIVGPEPCHPLTPAGFGRMAVRAMARRRTNREV